MSKSLLPSFFVALVFLQSNFSICSPVVDTSSLSTIQSDVAAKRVCSANIEECLPEPEMESEISRRALLMQRRYISFETLRRDMIPCSKPGASYYNCHSVAANPYTRGCEVITRCARDASDIQT